MLHYEDALEVCIGSYVGKHMSLSTIKGRTLEGKRTSYISEQG